jgi:hypothetical protein
MGMFDNLQYQGHQYQTKDTPRQAIDNYKIEVDQDSGHAYLWLEQYDAEFVEDSDHLLGAYIKQSNHRWVCNHDFDGLVRFYREDHARGGHKNDAWIEYKALFMNGQMIKLQQTAGEPLTVWYQQGIKELNLKENK